MPTLVIQSHRSPLPAAWLEPCLESVRSWAARSGFDYRFLGDEIFASLEPDLLDKTAAQPVVASDIARLDALQAALDEGFEAAIWCDADFLVFAPEALRLPGEHYAIGRELWVQRDGRRLRTRVQVHNAFMLYRAGNPFLPFYRDAARRLVRAHDGPMVPQFAGPKLLTAIHNVVQCPVVEAAGMLSPLVVGDLLAGGGRALDAFARQARAPLGGANLCASLAGREIDAADLARAVDLLLARGAPL